MVPSAKNFLKMLIFTAAMLCLLVESEASKSKLLSYLNGFCRPGQMYVHDNNTCVECPTGTFQSADRHQNIRCLPCSSQEEVVRERKDLILLTKCNSTADTTFTCGPDYYPLEQPGEQHSDADLPTCLLLPCDDKTVNTRPESAPKIGTTTPTNHFSRGDSKAVDDDTLNTTGTVRNNVTTPCNRSSPGECGHSEDEGPRSGCETTCIVVTVMVLAGGIAIAIFAAVCVVMRYLR